MFLDYINNLDEDLWSEKSLFHKLSRRNDVYFRVFLSSRNLRDYYLYHERYLVGALFE